VTWSFLGYWCAVSAGCAIWLRIVAKALDALESHRQQSILQSTDDFEWTQPPRRHTDRLVSEATSRRELDAMARGR
jgi:hypothetical protein